MPAAAAVRPPQEDKYLKDLVAELHLWSRMHHPNICQFLGAVTRARESVLLVADYCERGSLHRVLMGHLRERSKMPFATRMRYARGIACGMAYLHRQRIPAGPRTPGSSGGGQGAGRVPAWGRTATARAQAARRSRAQPDAAESVPPRPEAGELPHRRRRLHQGAAAAAAAAAALLCARGPASRAAGATMNGLKRTLADRSRTLACPRSSARSPSVGTKPGEPCWGCRTRPPAAQQADEAD